jgi:hypothetical protein
LCEPLARDHVVEQDEEARLLFSLLLFSLLHHVVHDRLLPPKDRLEDRWVVLVVMYFWGMYWLSQNLWLELTSVL